MGRVRHWQRSWSRQPWNLPHEDLCEADDGEIPYQRDLVTRGRAERHLAMHVVGQFDRGLVLGLIAIRCERRHGQLIPLTLSIPDDPSAMSQPEPSRPQKYWWIHGEEQQD